MTVKSYTVGEGELLLGTDPFSIASQLTSCTVQTTENVTTRDARKVLSGEELPARTTVTFSQTLSGTVFQDYDAAGLVNYTHDHAGEQVDFVYSPRNSLNRAVSGIVTIVPLTIGGEVEGDEPTADFTWRVTATAGRSGLGAVFGVYDPVEDTVTEDV